MILPIFFATSSLYASSLEQLLSMKLDGVEWDSMVHRHEYSDPVLKTLVGQIIDEFIERPDQFQQQIQKLKYDQKMKLIEDSGTSRTDLIDLLSVEFKMRIQDRWKNHFTIPYHHSEIWSLAKYRLKTSIKSDLKLSTGVSVFRAPGMASTQGVLACALGDFRQTAGPRDARKPLDVGGVHFRPFTLRKADTIVGHCGERTLSLSRKDEALPRNWDWKPMLSFTPRSQDLLRVVAVLGLNATTPESMKKATLAFLKYWRGYSLISERTIDLRTEFDSLFVEADIFMPLIDLPNDGNKFIFFGASKKGLRIDLKRSVGERNIWLSILLPPVDAKAPARESVSLSQSEFRSLIAERQSPLIVIDLACFSNVYLKDWAGLFLDPSRKLQPGMMPHLIGSKRGQRGEASVQILPQVDILFHSIDRFAADFQILSLSEALQSGSPTSRALARSSEWLQKIKMPISLPNSFEPASTNDLPYSEIFMAPVRTPFHLIEDSALKIYNPYPEGSFEMRD